MIRDIDKLRDFCRPDTDRFEYLSSYLEGLGVPSVSLKIEESRNIFVHFSPGQFDPRDSIKVLTAHYDRADGSPGANDNSAAVFQLAALAARLVHTEKVHNTLVIFTDHEEIHPDNPSVETQGAYKLGQFLSERGRKTHGTDVRYVFFNFDLCGVGDTLILSTAGDSLLERSRLSGGSLHRRMRELQTAALEIMGRVRGCRYFTLETPFSDNIGLLLNNFPSALITILPYQEAVGYRSRFRRLQQDLQKRPGESEDRPGFLVDTENEERNRLLRDIIPRTWDRMHTDDDRIETLEEEAFRIMDELLTRIADTRIPVSRAR